MIFEKTVKQLKKIIFEPWYPFKALLQCIND